MSSLGGPGDALAPPRSQLMNGAITPLLTKSLCGPIRPRAASGPTLSGALRWLTPVGLAVLLDVGAAARTSPPDAETTSARDLARCSLAARPHPKSGCCPSIRLIGPSSGNAWTSSSGASGGLPSSRNRISIAFATALPEKWLFVITAVSS